VLVSACAARSAFRAGERAERAQDYDRAVVEYTKAARARPDDRNARAAVERARLRASQEHFFRGRRLAGAGRYEEAQIELQLATELNPGDAEAAAALSDVRRRMPARGPRRRGPPP